jgi:hypothetical protein
MGKGQECMFSLQPTLHPTWVKVRNVCSETQNILGKDGELNPGKWNYVMDRSTKNVRQRLGIELCSMAKCVGQKHIGEGGGKGNNEFALVRNDNFKFEKLTLAS